MILAMCELVFLPYNLCFEKITFVLKSNKKLFDFETNSNFATLSF